jgi:hypothetical protein
MSVGTTILVSRAFIVTILSHGNIQKGRVQFVFLNQNQVVTHHIIGRDFNNLGVLEKMGPTRPLFNAEERSHHLASHDHKYGLIDVCNWIVSKK